MTPYFMMFGRHPKCPEDLILDKPEIDFHVSANSYAFNLKENLKRAFTIIQKQSDMKIDLSQIRYNRDYIACKFEIGDLVLVRQFKVEPGACQKFSNKWRGPYVVLNRIDQLVYSLKPVKAKGKKITMHRNNLKRYIARELATNTTTEVDTNPTTAQTVQPTNTTPPSTKCIPKSTTQQKKTTERGNKSKRTTNKNISRQINVKRKG